MVKTPSFFERLTGGGSNASGASDTTSDTTSDATAPAEVAVAAEAGNETTPVATTQEPEAQENTPEQQETWMEEAQEGQLTIDVYQTDKDIVIKSTVAGVSPDELDIAITNDMVTIRGRRDRDEEVAQDQYFYQECYWGSFSRSVILPADVASDKAEATMRHGILTIRLPKVEKEQTKKIKVRAIT